ncbi:MAG: AraC family transcriptional regulator [Cyclobacteriaceae bacterium]|nr:MAG: AraC family transcriptional regulator [Cyclobacteriaceae bacterium]
MAIQYIPEIFLRSKKQNPELYIYDFKMTEDVVKSKVNLSLHMFSFLQTGEKKVQLEDAFVEVNNKQSVLIKSGNCIMTELLDNEQIYFCKLFFFSNKNIVDFLERHPQLMPKAKVKYTETPFFVIENDDYIHSFVSSISTVLKMNMATAKPLLSIKFEEIMLYLSQKYGNAFVNYIQSLAHTYSHSSFREIVEANTYSNLSIPEIAFLANMSLSTFKRHFIQEYHENPGKWFQQKRLSQAKKILDQGSKKPSEIFAAFGYNNLSNFSTAFKNEFGYSPKATTSAVE